MELGAFSISLNVKNLENSLALHQWEHIEHVVRPHLVGIGITLGAIAVVVAGILLFRNTRRRTYQ